MGIFDNMFKSQRDLSKEDIKEVPWHALTELKQLDELDEESKDKTVAIFKHSTRCGISRMVLKNFENEFRDEKERELKLYFLDLLSNREISNEIAKKYDVHHESPQLIVIKDKKVVHHASHQSIDAGELKQYN